MQIHIFHSHTNNVIDLLIRICYMEVRRDLIKDLITFCNICLLYVGSVFNLYGLSKLFAWINNSIKRYWDINSLFCVHQKYSALDCGYFRFIYHIWKNNLWNKINKQIYIINFYFNMDWGIKYVIYDKK